MSKMTANTPGYEHTEQWDTAMISVGYMPLILESARALQRLQQQWDEIVALDKNGGITRFHEDALPVAIVLEIDGEPMGVVRTLDDTWQFCPFKSERVEVDEK